MALQAPAYPRLRFTGHAQAPATPALTASTQLAERIGNALPVLLSLGLVASLFLAPWHRGSAAVLAVFLLLFFAYWLVRSYAVAVACLVGLRRLNAWERTDWVARYCAWLPAHSDAEGWNWPRHLVIIPNYKESEAGLARTLDSLAGQANAAQLVVVLAMEARELPARARATRLLMRYRGRFGTIFATYHPAGLPAEAPGKGSNEAWAAREAYTRLVNHEGDDIRRYTVTSCDADALFHPRHFQALNYLFLTSGDRYRTFWQPAIFNSNNIWDIPAPLRIPDGLSGINRLSNLVLPGSVRFPTSCYSLSWQMLDEVDYWDEEVIPEDWHVYLKCCFTLGDRVRVEPLYLPLGNDCVLAGGYTTTLRAHYFQSVRHAWGATDIPYAWRAALGEASPLGPRRRFLLAASVTKVHVLWLAQWYIVTVGVLLPARFATAFNAPMPGWWVHRYRVPGTGWHPENILDPSAWFAFNQHGLVEPTMWLNLCGILVAICIVPLFVLIAVEYRARGPRPAHISRKVALASFAVWPLMAVITFCSASLPALHAQLKLARGRGLVYRVAEKGRRAPTAAASATNTTAGGPFPAGEGLRALP